MLLAVGYSFSKPVIYMMFTSPMGETGVWDY